MRVKRVAEWETTKGKRHVWLRSKEKKKNTVTCTVLTQIVTNIVFIIFFYFFFQKTQVATVA